MSVYHLIYRSVECLELSEEGLNDLLVRARLHNQQHAITGILLHGARQYMQVLEGDVKLVTELYGRIEADARHTEVALMTDGFSPSRIFPRWSMGFLAATAEDFIRLVEYIDPDRQLAGRPARSTSVAQGYLALLEEFALSRPVLF